MTTRTETVNQSANQFLEGSPLKLFIGGAWMASKSKTFETYDPGTGGVLAEVYEASAADVDHAVQAAKLAFEEKEGWSQLLPSEPAVYLHRLADVVGAILPIP